MSQLSKNQPIVTLYGNLGRDPMVHELPAKEETRPVYDDIIDEVVEKTFTRPAKTFRTFSIAVQSKEAKEPRWIFCQDWKNLSENFRQGDRVWVKGYFDYYVDKDDQRQKKFVVTAAGIEKLKVHRQAA